MTRSQHREWIEATDHDNPRHGKRKWNGDIQRYFDRGNTMTRSIPGVLDYAKLNPPDGYDLSERIRQLAAQGLRVRDISALLGIHPMLVLRVLGEAKANAS